MRKLVMIIGLAAVMMVGTATVALADGEATCADVVGKNHGNHVVADYVDGEGNASMAWPPAGGVDAAGGAALPGGPGPGSHFPNGVAPGASFCISQSQSPGFHLP